MKPCMCASVLFVLARVKTPLDVTRLHGSAGDTQELVFFLYMQGQICVLLPPPLSATSTKLALVPPHGRRQASSFDGDDNSTINPHASPGYHPQTTPNAKSSPPATIRSSSPSPLTVSRSGRSSPSQPSAAAKGGGGDGKSATAEQPPPPGGAGASSAAARAGLVGPWGRGTPEDELRAEGGGGGVLGEPVEVEVEVPQEPDAGHGVSRLLFVFLASAALTG